MKKIVINTQFGGFGLSTKAHQEYAKLIGKEAYFFKYNFNSKEYVLADPVEDKDELIISVFTIPNPNEFLRQDKPWHEMSLEERKKHNEKYKSVDLNMHDLARDDENLIKVVEKLGEEANTRFSTLKIIEIPDDVEWEIEEYDGLEHIAEKHRTWR
jgi:hypothetical protein